MKEKRNGDFFKGTVALSVSVIITKILGVAFKVPLSYVLTDEGMGYFNTAYAIYGFFYILCTAGVPKSLTLVISGVRSESSGYDSDREVLRCGLSLFAKIGAFSTLLNIICAPALASLVRNKSACLSIIFVAPSIFFVSLSGVLRGYLNSSQRLTSIAISQIIEGALKLALGLAFALLGARSSASLSVVSALAISGISIGSLVSFLYMFVIAFYGKINIKKRQNCDFSYKNISRKILKNALPIALSSSLLNLSATLDLTIIIRRLVASGMSETHANSLYGNYTTLAVPMFNLVIAVLAPISTSYMPRLASLDLEGKNEAFEMTLRRLLIITLFISVPASFAFYFYSFDLLDVLFSLQSSALGAQMLAALSLGVCLLAILTVVNTALESRRRIHCAVFSLVLGCIVKLAASYLLIGRASLGILGAPLGTVLSYAVSLTVSVMLLERSSVRARALRLSLAFFTIGIISFYPSYRLVYATSLIGSSFLSMLLSLTISAVLYLGLVFAAYIFFDGDRVFKMHKKIPTALCERPKN